MADTQAALAAIMSNAMSSNNANNDADPDDLQIAWEVFETCRIIYNKYPEYNQHLLVKVLSRIADISMENEDFEAAYHDFNQALSIELTLYPSYHKNIAVTHWHLGMFISFKTI